VIRSDSESEKSEGHEIYENGEWETLRDKETKEKSTKHMDIRNKYYYDWGKQYAGKK
jgi:hypothetical protein